MTKTYFAHNNLFFPFWMMRSGGARPYPKRVTAKKAWKKRGKRSNG